MLIGSIEAGGTKFICSVGTQALQIIDQVRIETTTASETMNQVIAYFKRFPTLKAISIASFGPLDLNPNSPQYGWIKTTPKPGWSNVDLLGIVKQALAVPVTITSDVNGSAIGESALLAQSHQPVASLVYITVGTGIGAGIIVNGQLIGTTGHPEIGHVAVVSHPDDQDFTGICPFHQGCLEGMAAGPSLLARTGIPGERILHSDPVWHRIAYYLAQAAVQMTLTLRPERIVFGGSVVGPDLIPLIREQFAQLLNGYLEITDLDNYLALSIASDNNSATLGNLISARELIRQPMPQMLTKNLNQ